MIFEDAVKIGIIGITGRMGSILKRIIEETPGYELSGGICGKDTMQDFKNLAKVSDVFIDFSRPEAAITALTAASEAGIPCVSGTTGFSKNDMEKIRPVSEKIPVLYASNFSVGVQLMAILLKKCSTVLKDFDVSVVEKHHKNKKDAPSGTAMFLAESVQNTTPQILSIRSGGILGDHICDFIGKNEMLTISHRAFNRDVFAENALKCAKWLCSQEPGLYSIVDYLGLENEK